MKSVVKHPCIHLMLIAGILAQTFMSTAVLAMEASGMDVAGLICSPSGQSYTSGEIDPALKELLEELGLTDPADLDQECPALLLAGGFTWSMVQDIQPPKLEAASYKLTRYEAQLKQQPQGPPLGGRAPPPLT